MGEFIKVEIDLSKCLQSEDVARWVEVCPVNIFRMVNGQPEVVATNEDECTLCRLCVEACSTDAITIHKLYES